MKKTILVGLLLLIPFSFAYTGTTTYYDAGYVNITPSFLDVNGVLACLQDGSGCPAGASGFSCTGGNSTHVNVTNSTSSQTCTMVALNPGGGGSPGGSDTQIQFNDGGSFGGNANFTFNKTTGQLVMGGGTGTYPAYGFDSLDNTGMYWDSHLRLRSATGDQIVMMPAGASFVFDVNSAYWISGGAAQLSRTGDLPYGLYADSGTGFSHPDGDQVGLRVDGVDVLVAGDDAFDEAVLITPDAATDIGLTVQGVASQSANLQEWQNSSGGVLSYIDSLGQPSFNGGDVIIASGNPAVGLVRIAGDAETGMGVSIENAATSPTASYGTFRFANPENADNTWTTMEFASGSVGGQNSGIFGLQYTDASNNYGEFSFWLRDASGMAERLRLAPTTEFKPDGTNTVLTISDSSDEAVLITPDVATDIGLTVQGAASQSANLTEWQNSSGSALAYVPASADDFCLADGTCLSTAGGGTPGGSDTQIQFNDGGSFGGNANFTFNATAQQVRFPDGDVTTPSIANDDGTSGLFFNGDSTRISYAGTQYLTTRTSPNGIATGTSIHFLPGLNAGIVWSEDTDTSIKSNDADKIDFTVGGSEVVSFGDSAYDEAVLINPATSTDIGLTVQGAASQSANLQEWQDSSGTVLASLKENNGGVLTLSSSGASGYLLNVQSSNNGASGAKIYSIGQPLYVYNAYAVGSGYDGIVSTFGRTGSQTTSAAVGLTAHNSYSLEDTSGTDYQIVQNAWTWNNATSTARRGKMQWKLLNTSNDFETAVEFSRELGGHKVNIIGAGTQTANLTEWQNSSGTVLVAVQPSGNITMKSPDDSYWNCGVDNSGTFSCS
jgi:hypothetical protein